MVENKEFISASDLPEAEGEEVSVLCLENGEMKQKPANGLGGGEKADMIITVTMSGIHNINVTADNFAITSGSGEAVIAAIRAGRPPVVKVRYAYNSAGDYNVRHSEQEAVTWLYGETLYIMYTTCGFTGDWSTCRLILDADGTFSIFEACNITCS